MLNTLVLFLLLCPQFASALFDSQSALPQIFHNWLHFASNFHSPHNAPPAPHPRDANVPLAVPPPPLPSYVLGAATSNATLTFEITYHRQIMHRSEIDLIASYLRRNDIYLEFGSGASTFNFAPLVSRAYSIEHNCDWLNRMPSNIPQRAANYSNLHLKCIPILPGTRGWGTLSPFEHANYFQFRRYVDAVDSLAEPKFDKVLIDGRASTSYSQISHIMFRHPKA